MTNYERIKAMSVEEMAKKCFVLFAGACKAARPFRCPKKDIKDGLFPCEQCALKWLNSEVEK